MLTLSVLRGQVRPGLIELAPDECAIIVNYEVRRHQAKRPLCALAVAQPMCMCGREPGSAGMLHINCNLSGSDVC